MVLTISPGACCAGQVYDFALPLLVLHAFTFKTMDNLKRWLNICPRRQITVLDTHDGPHFTFLSVPATQHLSRRNTAVM